MKRIEHNESELLFPYVEYLPETETDSPLPLIIQLHGAGERGHGGDELHLVDKLGFSKLIADRDIPCRFVMPQCRRGQYWACRVESVLAFIDKVISERPTDTSRVYLTGLSMGGFGTWFTAIASPDRFAAIAPVCGGGMDWASSTLHMPVWVFHGAEDPTVSPLYSDLMVKGLESHGRAVRYTRLDGVKHNVWLQAYTDELLDWLLAQSKEEKK